ncbi:MAG: Smr/MutS family protein [Hyphomicrobium sp.]|nr:Smr/MutS family protein [Hyphomicrobium sp.]
MADDREGRGRPLKPPPGKRGARLSPEERALWEHTASSLQPIKGKKGRVHAALEDADERADSAASKREIAKAAAKKPHAAPRPLPTPPKVTLPPPAPAPIALERRKARKLSSGRIEIDGRIDLHGMRQSEAHDALRRFLKRGYAEGKRWVLVITGKGAPARTALDERAEREGFERGVLRRNVPRWLAEPELAGIVIGFTTAAVNHGGEGALYVHLRKRNARPGDDV